MNDRKAWLQGPGNSCLCTDPLPARAWRLVLLGPPGAGKGTQAGMIVNRQGPCHLSTGDVFRHAIGRPATEASPAMCAALGAMKRGELVDDRTVLDIVGERVNCLSCARGFLLDGFPRTLAQAQALDRLLDAAGVKLDAVINLVLADEIVIERIAGRRVCRSCKAVWHTDYKPARVAGVCDHCGGELYRRGDDEPAATAQRLSEYHQTSARD